MLDSETQKRLTDLSADAQSSLADLLQFEGVKNEQWFLRRSVEGSPYGWELLTSESAENDRLIKERIARSQKPVTGLVLAYLGLVQWRGKKQLMAYLQCFRAGYKDGILCLRHLKEETPGQKFEPHGAFLIAGSCKNIWI